ncbi:hypothetical protein [Methylorubrum extorquens]|uniref:Uncharacterized protein n=1 Tax=Methylorubrum extorquens (strain CM4 / NCIMB 13688) TaxID=440085 RepID=B7L3R3_METC4|nr:hypothetical protein [Methylorubrum extorquens]ACK86471.1 hypothetical protein Mchl_5759 [Methylorubrum extorquens CM4]
MPDLPNSKALRHAAQGGGYLSTGRGVLNATADEPHPLHYKDGRGLRIQFSLQAGGGKSAVIAWIAPADFDVIADLMMQADPVAAQRAFGNALVKDAKRKR